MAEPDVLIRRLFALGRGAPGTQVDSGLLDSMARELARPLEAALAAQVGEGYWVIRRVDVSSCVGTTWSASQIAVAVAGQVGEAVRRRAHRGADPNEVLWFPDREAFWAGYLLDLARGHVHARWEYAGLDPGPSWSRAAAAIGSETPDLLAAALGRLSVAELDELASRVDGDRLLEALAREPAGPGPVLAALRRLRGGGRLVCGSSTGLLLAVTALGSSTEATSPGRLLAALARPALDTAAVVRLTAAVPGSPEPVLEAVVAGRWGEVADAAGTDDGFLGLVRWSAAERAELTEVLRERPGIEKAARVRTRFGGAFVLLGLLPDLVTHDPEVAAWFGLVGDAVPLGRLALLAAAMGAARFDAAAQDHALRLVLDVSEQADLRGWLAGLIRSDGAVPAALPPVLGTAAAALLRDLGRRLPGMRAASSTYLWHNVLDVEAWVTPTTRLVELGHAPLSVLLAMTGLDRAELGTDREGERRWRLTSAG